MRLCTIRSTMDIVVSHITAFHWLVRNASPAQGTRRGCRMRRLPPAAPRIDAAQRTLHALSLSDEQLHVAVSTAEGKRSRHPVVSHLWSADLPSRAVIPLDFPSIEDRLFIASPEFVFLQLATTYPLEQAVYFGFALCASYRIDEWTPGGIALRASGDASPTSTAKIAAFLDRAGSVRGSTRARRALAFVRDNSFSPMESGIAISLCMPLRHGGFNLGTATMNPTLKIRAARRLDSDAPFIERKPDLTIEAKGRDGLRRRVALDYDSVSFHAGQASILHDIERRNEFAALSGITYFSLTTALVNDFAQYEQMTRRIRRALGKRSEPARAAGELRFDFQARCSKIWHAQFELWSEVVRQSSFRRIE